MLTSSGAKCDVCGKYILPIDPDELVNHFTVKGIEEELHADNACKKRLLEAGGDWTKLPEGPLRTVFEKASAKMTPTP